MKTRCMPHRSIHKLRKTYCTMLIDAGCEDSIIMNQLGHASIETSRKYYYFCNRTKQHQMDQVRKAINI
ncbi:tyrosine-type recombinase/integrase [Mediterraneibacter faecis]|uniref:tyrosine-type recombinase/integrase n=1 Tax=Mediterraneibacter faecis TaxID=592978 RepID=UPI003991A782